MSRIIVNVQTGEVTNDPDFISEDFIPALTINDVVKERERRLALGFNFDFKDSRGIVRISTSEGDMKGWDEVTKKALAKFALGKKANKFFIVPDKVPIEIDSDDWFKILEAADTFREPIWFASFNISNMNPIPLDFRDNKYWPPIQ